MRVILSAVPGRGVLSVDEEEKKAILAEENIQTLEETEKVN